MTLQGMGLLKPSECRHMEEGWPNHHTTFIAAEIFYFTVPLFLFTVYVGLVEDVIWGEGSKIAQKRHIIERSLNDIFIKMQ